MSRANGSFPGTVAPPSAPARSVARAPALSAPHRATPARNLRQGDSDTRVAARGFCVGAPRETLTSPPRETLTSRLHQSCHRAAERGGKSKDLVRTAPKSPAVAGPPPDLPSPVRTGSSSWEDPGSPEAVAFHLCGEGSEATLSFTVHFDISILFYSVLFL